MTILCVTCLQQKDESEFWPSMVALVKGRGWRGVQCKACKRKYDNSGRPEFEGKDDPDAKKLCGRCKVDQGREAFPPSAWKKKRGVWCRECSRQYYAHRRKTEPGYASMYDRRRSRERVAEIAQIKASRGCSRCGENHPACLDFHHVDWRTKKKTIAQLTAQGNSVVSIMAEMEKCILLCSNCHRKHHHEQGGHRHKKHNLILPPRKNPTRKVTVTSS